MVDPVEFARELIRCRSVTPADDGALGTLQRRLETLGFTCHRLKFADADTPDVENLYARIGTQGPNFCFAGHTDVVPTGNLQGWTVDPFAAEIHDGFLYGRGAVDMKGAIAAFASAAARFVGTHAGKLPGSISLLITGDEEGPAINGTVKVLDWMAKRGEKLDVCVVGEPTNESALGDMAKIGRRGSVNATLVAKGVQGHVAYPHLADNPVHRLIRLLGDLTSKPLDAGNAHFQPSSLQVTTIDVGNPTENLIPAEASARLNIRFNDMHTSRSLLDWIAARAEALGGKVDIKSRVSGESFITHPGALSELVSGAVEKVAGRRPALSTTGGTSDARFIARHCKSIEFGLVGRTMHKTDERVAVADLVALSEIYANMLDGFFAAPAAQWA
ncbi:MAG: succinyl-diaminopimelate desuccinylase [Alphaproteobacteria bacterium]|nr:succinyl-diaminopimelate desuccinylase [Alphaproteobacteria bacterium]